jgi:hypothetical protein
MSQDEAGNVLLEHPVALYHEKQNKVELIPWTEDIKNSFDECWQLNDKIRLCYLRNSKRELNQTLLAIDDTLTIRGPAYLISSKGR